MSRCAAAAETLVILHNAVLGPAPARFVVWSSMGGKFFRSQAHARVMHDDQGLPFTFATTLQQPFTEVPTWLERASEAVKQLSGYTDNQDSK